MERGENTLSILNCKWYKRHNLMKLRLQFSTIKNYSENLKINIQPLMF